MATTKGKKRVKNVPVLHDEVKSRHHVLLTPSSWAKLQRHAATKGISVSELIEQWAIDLDGD